MSNEVTSQRVHRGQGYGLPGCFIFWRPSLAPPSGSAREPCGRKCAPASSAGRSRGRERDRDRDDEDFGVESVVSAQADGQLEHGTILLPGVADGEDVG